MGFKIGERKKYSDFIQLFIFHFFYLNRKNLNQQFLELKNGLLGLFLFKKLFPRLQISLNLFYSHLLKTLYFIINHFILFRFIKY
jgi:hypothetical protein